MPIVKLGEILRPNRDTAEINSFCIYKQITVRLHHKGIILRGEKNGQDIKSKQYLARKGHFIISRIDARNGAMGLVPEELDGAVVTNDFLVYDIDESKILPRYLDYLTSTRGFVSECTKASEGTTNRVRLKPAKFLEIQIQLPSLEMQKQTITNIKKIEEVKKLQGETEKEMEELILCILDKAFDRVLCGS